MSARHYGACIDAQHLTGYERGVLAGEEDRCAREVLWAERAFERAHRDDLGDSALGNLLLSGFGERDAGCDAVHPDAPVPEFACRHLGQPDDTPLTPRISE